MEEPESRRMFYKYRKFNHDSLSMFINKEIYFAQPTSFNDPFDGQMNLTRAAEYALASLKKTSNSKGRVPLEVLLKDIDLDMLSESMKSIGIFSLSTKRREVLLWSHYADEHKGFSVGFELADNDSSVEDTFFNRPWEVKYTSDNPFLKFINSFADNKVDSATFETSLLLCGVTHKSTNWKYESEHRLITAKPGFKRYQPSVVKEVIFGLNMALKHKRTLKSLLSGPEWKHVKFHQAYRDGYELQLKTRYHRE